MRKAFVPHWLLAAAMLALAIGVPMSGSPRLQLPALVLITAGAALGITAILTWWLRQRDGR